MHSLRNDVCAVLATATLAAVAVPALAGYAAAEGGPSNAAANPGLVTGVIAHLKREDDEAEVRAIAENPRPRDERKTASERREEEAEAEVGQHEATPTSTQGES